MNGRDGRSSFLEDGVEVVNDYISRLVGHDHPTLTPKETATVLGLGLSQTYVAMERGQIPSFNLGTRRVPRYELAFLLAHGSLPPAPTSPASPGDVTLVA
ncbi:MAG TPA: hypothetical protein VMW47_11090 [Verrucomicrobiae bacterium]|nr:hypothetical protein [Verrucomicrobiae bacterium]